jgi:hypothetical protein
MLLVSLHPFPPKPTPNESPVTQNVCVYCGQNFLRVNSDMHCILILRIILDHEQLQQDSNGIWRMHNRSSRWFCAAHQVFTNFGRVFDVDFGVLPGRVNEMKDYLTDLKRNPNQYPFLADIRACLSSRRSTTDLPPSAHAQSEYAHYG